MSEASFCEGVEFHGPIAVGYDRPTAGGKLGVTVRHQYGSGYGEIALRLAKHLRWHLIEHEVVAWVAHELRVPEEQAEERDEHAQGLVALW